MKLLFNPFYSSFKHPRFTREQLRNVARILNIPRGRNTKDTVDNLRKAGVIVWTLYKQPNDWPHSGSKWTLLAQIAHDSARLLLNCLQQTFTLFRFHFVTCSSARPRVDGMLQVTLNSRHAVAGLAYTTLSGLNWKTSLGMVAHWNLPSEILKTTTIWKFTTFGHTLDNSTIFDKLTPMKIKIYFERMTNMVRIQWRFRTKAWQNKSFR